MKREWMKNKPETTLLYMNVFHRFDVYVDLTHFLRAF